MTCDVYSAEPASQQGEERSGGGGRAGRQAGTLLGGEDSEIR